MMWSTLILLLFVYNHATVNAGGDFMLQWRGSCNYYDTVNISSGRMDAHENFHFEGITFEKGSYSLYDYIMQNFTDKVDVEEHYRGCICRYRNCIRLCCVSDEEKHEACVKSTILQAPTQDQDDFQIDLDAHEYGALVGKPCGQMYRLEPLDYADDQWFFLKVSAN
jgi:hypothetical protein